MNLIAEVPQHSMYFLLKDDGGRALVITESPDVAQAEMFGRTYLPEFTGDLVEIDAGSREEAEEFWDVRTVRLMRVVLDPDKKPSRVASKISTRLTWVRGPELPDDVERDGLLTTEDRRAIALDHIARTSDVVAHVKITFSSAPSRAGR